MLKRIDERTLSAFARLRLDADWEQIRNWITESRANLLAECTTTRDDTTLRWAQGAAQALGEWLEIESKASEVSHRMRTRA